MQERYEATMLLSGVGDALGYNNGRWEFNYSGAAILQELNIMTGGAGVTVLNLSDQRWCLSDGERNEVLLLLLLVGSDGETMCCVTRGVYLISCLFCLLFLDTILHIATAEGLINHKRATGDEKEKSLMQWIAIQYKVGS